MVEVLTTAAKIAITGKVSTTSDRSKLSQNDARISWPLANSGCVWWLSAGGWLTRRTRDGFGCIAAGSGLIVAADAAILTGDLDTTIAGTAWGPRSF